MLTKKIVSSIRLLDINPKKSQFIYFHNELK